MNWSEFNKGMQRIANKPGFPLMPVGHICKKGDLNVLEIKINRCVYVGLSRYPRAHARGTCCGRSFYTI